MPIFMDLTGQRFGMLTVISRASGAGRPCWHCRCDCGGSSIVPSKSLRSGNSKSCGCRKRAGKKPTHGRRKSPEWRVWQGMKSRCLNPKNSRFSDYGGRGIQVCPRWQHSFENFLTDMGERPSSEHSLDRKDGDGNYEPNNCRWATRIEQCRNKRNNVLITHSGRTQCLSAWASESKVSPQIFRIRLMGGWTMEQALIAPIGERKLRPQFGANQGRAVILSGEAS